MHWLPVAALAACDSGSEPPRPAAVAISPPSANLSSLGETATFTAKITDQNGDAYAGTVAWSSSDAAVFTVTAQGAATSVGNGSGTLTASFGDLSATAPLVVEQVPTAITLAPDFASLSYLGETAAFTGLMTDANGAEVSGTLAWSSTNPGVFTVDMDGLVTAVANGTAALTSSSGDLTAQATVRVEQVPAALLAASGDEQEGTAGTPLEDSLAVRVDDAGGSPVEGVPVGFEPAEGHGSAGPAAADTDADGLSRTQWTLGPDSGVQTLTARLARDMSVEFTASARPPEPRPDSALYRIEFEATWSDSTHPDDFPANAHFSPLIGGVHNDSVRFWELGDTASPGMEEMAETGRTRILEGEIRAEMPDNALAVVEGSGTRSPGSSQIDTVVVNTEYPLVMLVTMIAPSPDWFAGVTGLSLLDEDGEWVEELEVLLYPLDAGTDSGTTYTSPNRDTSPQEPITSLKGQYPFSDEPVGTYVFTLIEKSGGG